MGGRSRSPPWVGIRLNGHIQGLAESGQDVAARKSDTPRADHVANDLNHVSVAHALYPVRKPRSPAKRIATTTKRLWTLH